MTQIVLASTSRYRHELLCRLGLPFEAAAPDVDERAVALPPREMALALASAKAEAVLARFPEAVVIGSDQVATIDGEVLHKPGTEDNAVNQLRRLVGREHELLTAVCVASGDRRLLHLDVHRLTMRPLDDEALRDYVARDRPRDCAGSYRIESLGIALMAKVEGEDFTAIVGLPLMAVTRMLEELGVRVLGPN